MELATFMLYIVLIFKDGHVEREWRPVTVPACQPGPDGLTVEDSSCGIRACLREGRKRVAVHWGNIPGIGSHIICRKPETGEELTEGAEPAGGHAGLNWQ